MNSPIYDIVLALHVLSALVGFGSLAATGIVASRARRVDEPASDAVLARYFRPGRNLAARTVFLVPVLGVVLLILGHGQDVGAAWPWIGLGIWIAALGVATGLMWPAERRIQREFTSGSAFVADSAQLWRRLELGAALTSCAFVAAMVVMIAQPV